MAVEQRGARTGGIWRIQVSAGAGIDAKFRLSASEFVDYRVTGLVREGFFSVAAEKSLRLQQFSSEAYCSAT